MTQENWDYIANNWMSEDAEVQKQIAVIKAEDTIATNNLQTELEEKEKRIKELDEKYRQVHETNMSLFLRMTDPTNPLNKPQKNEEDIKVPKITDIDAFIIKK